MIVVPVTTAANVVLTTPPFAWTLAGAPRFATLRAGFAVRRLALALGFFTDFRADFADLVTFFLFPAVALEVLLADFTDALLMLIIIAANFVWVRTFL
jgi:hypothetical protein